MSDQDKKPEKAKVARFSKPWFIRWGRRTGIGIAATFLLYVIGGFLLVPFVLKFVVIGKINGQFVGSFEADRVAFNPFTWVLEVEDFKGLTTDGEVAASFSKFRVNLQPSTLFSEEFVVREVLWVKPHGTLLIDNEGQVNLVSLFGLEEADEPSNEAQKPSQPFVIPPILIETLEVRKAGALIRIESFEEPFERQLREISFKMEDVRTDASHDNPYQFALETADGEMIQVNGSLRLDPLSSSGSITLAELKMADFSTFGESQLDAKVANGVMDVSFDYQFRPLADQVELGILNGKLSIKDFNLQSRDSDQTIQRIDLLAIDGYYFDVANQKAGIDSILIDGVLLSALRSPQGSISLMGQASPSSTSHTHKSESTHNGTNEGIVTGVVSVDQDLGEAINAAAERFHSITGASGSTADAGLTVAVGGIQIRNANFSLIDQAVQPTTNVALSKLNLTIGPYVTNAGNPINIELGANLAAPAKGIIRIDGSLYPLKYKQMTDLKVTLDDVSMSTFAPYVTPIIGRPPTGGQLSVSVDCSIKNSALNATDKVLIRNIQLGPRDESSDAPNLPLDLAIAILQDTQGLMTIEIPISGNLDDPEFSYGKVVTYAITNVITKVATAPFRMLGNLVPGGDEFDEDFISFEAGGASLSKKGTKMTDYLAEAMQLRPGLTLVLTPAFSNQADSKALNAATFESKIEAYTKRGKSREAAIKALYKDLPKDLRKSGWRLPEQKVMEETLRKTISTSNEQLRALASRRAQAVKARLQEKGIHETQIRIAGSEDADSARVSLTFDIPTGQ